jgi:hypothetical protein
VGITCRSGVVAPLPSKKDCLNLFVITLESKSQSCCLVVLKNVVEGRVYAAIGLAASPQLVLIDLWQLLQQVSTTVGLNCTMHMPVN